MTELIFEGNPRVIAQFEHELRAELESMGLGSNLPIESKIVPVDVAPGELGFGEEIRQILVGLASMLKESAGLLGAVPKATIVLAEGIAKALSRNNFKATVTPDGKIIVEANTSGKQVDVVETTAAIAKLLRARQTGASAK